MKTVKFKEGSFPWFVYATLKQELAGVLLEKHPNKMAEASLNGVDSLKNVGGGYFGPCQRVRQIYASSKFRRP